MISNWTKHIKNCFDETQKLKKHGKQMSLTMFMPESSSTSETNTDGTDYTDVSDLDHARCDENSKVQVFQNPLSCIGDPEGSSITKSPTSVHIDWSYATRQSKKMLKLDQTQTFINDYMPFINNTATVIQKVEVLQNASTAFSNNEYFSTTLFKRPLLNAHKNCLHLPQGRRHSEVIKKLLSLLLTMGPSAYELLQKNLPEALPSLSTVQREANKCYSPLQEGEFMFDQLSTYLDVHNAPKIISMSEVATRIISRIEYDSNRNKIVGFVLPPDNNSLPRKDSFIATSFEVIEKRFTSSAKASNAYLYMAQPMTNDVPPFCFALLGTDNHFDAKVVLQRWKYIVKECAQ